MHFNVVDSPLRGSLKLFIRSDSQGSRALFGQPNARGESLLAVSADAGETVDRVLEKLQVLLKNRPGTHAWIEREGKELEGGKTLAGSSILDHAESSTDCLVRRARCRGSRVLAAEDEPGEV